MLWHSVCSLVDRVARLSALMLSRRTKYALKALLFLAREEPQRPVLISHVASREMIPKKFLEAILLDLKHQGLLSSKKGKGGGYFLAKSAEDITLGQVIRFLDGPLAPIGCVSKMAYVRCEECVDEETCGIRQVMQRVRDQTAAILDSTSLADVVRTVSSVERTESRERILRRAGRSDAS